MLWKIQQRPNGTLEDDAREAVAGVNETFSSDLQMTAIMRHLKGFSGVGDSGATSINPGTHFTSRFGSMTFPPLTITAHSHHRHLRPLIISIPGLGLSKSGTSDTLIKLPRLLVTSLTLPYLDTADTNLPYNSLQQRGVPTRPVNTCAHKQLQFKAQRQMRLVV